MRRQRLSRTYSRLRFLPTLDGGSSPSPTWRTITPAMNRKIILPELSHQRTRCVTLPANYGWPSFYFANGKPRSTPSSPPPQPTDHIFPPPPAGFRRPRSSIARPRSPRHTPPSASLHGRITARPRILRRHQPHSPRHLPCSAVQRRRSPQRSAPAGRVIAASPLPGRKPEDFHHRLPRHRRRPAASPVKAAAPAGSFAIGPRHLSPRTDDLDKASSTPSTRRNQRRGMKRRAPNPLH